MGELNRVQHEELAGSFSTEPFFGGFIEPLGRLYIPTKAEQVAGNHYPSVVNLADGLARRFGSAFAGAVYKDSADDDLEYSVRPFRIDVCGVVITYDGQTARGPLTAGVANYVYAAINGAGVISIGNNTVGWPVGPHQKLAVITPPASGPWLPQHLVRYDTATAVRPSNSSVYSVEATFAYNTASPLSIVRVPLGARIKAVTILIETPFNGTNPVLTVGDSVDDDRLMAAADNNPKVADIYRAEPEYKYSSDAAVTLTIAPDGSSAGAGVVIVEFRA